MRIISGKAKGTKLYTLEGTNTRPTLDRVKESIFNIIQNDIEDAEILDLFAVLCDKSKDATEIIKRNVQKTHMEEKTQILNLDFETCLDKVKNRQFDIIYIDPPYVTKYILKSIEKIIAQGNLKKEGIMILETDDEQRILREIESEEVRIVDKRKYGRATIIFLKLGIPRKG